MILKLLRLNLLYIVSSIFIGPLIILLGVAQTRDGGDSGSYFLNDAVDVAVRNADYRDALLVTLPVSIAMAVAGLILVVLLIMHRADARVKTNVLMLRIALTLVMVGGYSLTILLSYFWYIADK